MPGESNRTFIAREKCGCIVGAAADDPHCADGILEWLRDGLKIEAVSDDWFREHFLEKCEEHQNSQLPMGI